MPGRGGSRSAGVAQLVRCGGCSSGKGQGSELPDCYLDP